MCVIRASIYNNFEYIGMLCYNYWTSVGNNDCESLLISYEQQRERGSTLKSFVLCFIMHCAGSEDDIIMPHQCEPDGMTAN